MSVFALSNSFPRAELSIDYRERDSLCNQHGLNGFSGIVVIAAM